MIKIHDKSFMPYLSEEEIGQAVKKMAQDISTDLAGTNPLFVAVLNGAFMFASDLMKHLTIECEISFVKIKSYEGIHSTGEGLQLIGLETDIEDRTVVILEDIVDTGRTMKQLLANLSGQKAAQIKVATLLHKPDALQEKVPLDYIGFNIPTLFVVGYGLDYDEMGRNYPRIYQLSEE